MCKTEFKFRTRSFFEELCKKNPFLIKKAANRSKTIAHSVKLETLHNEMLGTVTKKQFYSNEILKTIKISTQEKWHKRQKRQVPNLC